MRAQFPSAARAVWLAVLLMAALAANALAAAPPLKVERLKRGDKLEMRQGVDWVPVEFVERVSDQIVSVKAPGFPQPISAIVQFLRLPEKKRGAKDAGSKAPPRDADDPFATPEEKAAASLRTWSARSGKFTVRAKLLRVEGDSVVLQREDDKEITVALEKLSDADREYASAWRDRKPLPKDPGDSPAEPDETEEPELPPEPELTETDLNAAEVVSLSEEKWTYAPDVPADTAPLPAKRIALQTTGFFDNPKMLMILPQEKRAFVALVDHHPGKPHSSRVQACNLQTGKVEAAGTFAQEIAPAGISPDGKWVLATVEKFGQEKDVLRLYKREGTKVEIVALWRPYSRAGSDPQKTWRPHREVTWAKFVSPSRLLTISGEGELACWSVPELKPLYTATCVAGNVPALSANAKYVIVQATDGLVILQATDGAVVGKLPTENTSRGFGQLAISDDGQRVALVEHGRVRVWDLAKRELAQEFSCDASFHHQGQLEWVSDRQLLVNGSVVIDTQLRVPVWHYTAMAEAWRKHGKQIWFIERSPGRDSATLTAAKLPHEAAVKLAAKFKAEDLVRVKPGMEVMVELPGSDAVRQTVIGQLERNGLKVVPQANLKLVGAITSGETVEIAYRTFGSFVATKYQATQQVLTLSFQLGNETVWKYESRTGPPLHLQLKQGESIDAALARSMQQDEKTFGHISIPKFISKLPAGAEAGSSATPAG